MKLRLTRSGGIAGVRLAAEVDTDALGAADADELRRLLRDARLFERQARPAGAAAVGADRFVYRIAVEEGGRRRDVEIDEQSLPGEARPLIERLLALARRGRR